MISQQSTLEEQSLTAQIARSAIRTLVSQWIPSATTCELSEFKRIKGILTNALAWVLDALEAEIREQQRGGSERTKQRGLHPSVLR